MSSQRWETQIILDYSLLTDPSVPSFGTVLPRTEGATTLTDLQWKSARHRRTLTKGELTGYMNIDDMCQMALEMLHGLCQLGGIGIRGGEGGLEGERNDVWHVRMKDWKTRRSLLYTTPWPYQRSCYERCYTQQCPHKHNQVNLTTSGDMIMKIKVIPTP